MSRKGLIPKKITDKNGKETTVYVRAGDGRASDQSLSGTANSVRSDLSDENEMITSTDDYYDRAQDRIADVMSTNDKALEDIKKNSDTSRFLGMGSNSEKARRATDLATSASISSSFSDHVYDSTEDVPVQYLSSGREDEYNEALAARLYSDESFEEFYDQLSEDEKNPVVSIGNNIVGGVSISAIENQLVTVKEQEPELYKDILDNRSTHWHGTSDSTHSLSEDELKALDVQGSESWTPSLSQDELSKELARSIHYNSHDDAYSSYPIYDSLQHQYSEHEVTDKVETVMGIMKDDHKKTIRKSYDRLVKTVTGIDNN